MLLPLIFAAWAWRVRRTGQRVGVAPRPVSFALRLLLVTALAGVLAGAKVTRHHGALGIVFLADASRSMGQEQRTRMTAYMQQAARFMQAGDQVAVIAFAGDARRLNLPVSSPPSSSAPSSSPPLSLLAPSDLSAPGLAASTNMANALRQARNELLASPPGLARRIVLLSDGNENVGMANGGAQAAARTLAADGIVLDTVTLPPTLRAEALIDRLALPTRVQIGEPFAARVIVSSLTSQSANVSLRRSDRPDIVTQQARLHPGKNVVAFTERLAKQGFYRYSATLDAPDDTIRENNSGEGAVFVRGMPSVLVVTDDLSASVPLRRVLQSAGVRANFVLPDALPAERVALQSYDSVFLSNVSANALSNAQMTALASACREDGVGLGMIGGPNSFGAGGYKGTPVEDALPVTMDVREQKRLPSLAVALVIEDLEIPSSVNMSIEAAKGAIDLLEPIDFVGVLDCGGASGGREGTGFSPAGTWRIPMQRATDRDALKAAMQGLRDMGDPPNYDPYLMEAARVLSQTDAKVKHIVFLGDGDAVWEDAQNGSEATIRQIRGLGVTVSTVSSGADKRGLAFMARLAHTGGGQAYVSERASDLPRLLLRDQQTFSRPPIIELPFRVQAVSGDPLVSGIRWHESPPLLGCNVTTLKPTATLMLHSPDLDQQDAAILAGWRYGLGRALAFASDDRAHWGAAWLGWPGYARFWAQAVRWTLRPAASGIPGAQVRSEGGQGCIVVNAPDADKRAANDLRFSAIITPPGMNAGGAGKTSGIKYKFSLSQTGPGHYEGWFDVPQTGTYLIRLAQTHASRVQPEKSTLLALSVSYPPEYAAVRANPLLMAQLAQLGGGQTDVPPSQIFGGKRPATIATEDAAPLLLYAALCLFLLDLAARRLPPFAKQRRKRYAQTPQRDSPCPMVVG